MARGEEGQESTSHHGRSGWSPPSKRPDLDGDLSHSLMLGRPVPLVSGEPQQGQMGNSGPFRQCLRPALEGALWCRGPLEPWVPVWLLELPGSFQNYSLWKMWLGLFSSSRVRATHLISYVSLPQSVATK